MARIRTIKPEFWVSESVGQLSRNARLLFIGLWSLADDSGRLRGALAMVSGALFPYDLDAREAIGEWMGELIDRGMVRAYTGPDDLSYLDIPNWSKHQKIDKPSASKFPPFDESSTKPRESSTSPRDLSPLDQGSGIRDQGPGEELIREPDANLRQAPPDLSPDLRQAWGRIAKDFGHEIATKARDAAKRIFGSVSAKQLEQTHSAAHRRGCTHLGSEHWPDFTKQIRADKAGVIASPAPIDPEREAQRQAFLKNKAKEITRV